MTYCRLDVSERIDKKQCSLPQQTMILWRRLHSVSAGRVPAMKFVLEWVRVDEVPVVKDQRHKAMK